MENDTIREEIEFAKNVNIQKVKDSVQMALQRSEKEAEAFWNAIAEVESELTKATDEEIKDSNSKFFGRIFRWVRRVFDFNTNKDRHPIYKYDRRTINEYRRGGWCGPWVCGYILYANQKEDKYNYFENCASTFGEFGVGNLSLRLLGRPMTPVEMGWSMLIASNFAN